MSAYLIVITIYNFLTVNCAAQQLILLDYKYLLLPDWGTHRTSKYLFVMNVVVFRVVVIENKF